MTVGGHFERVAAVYESLCTTDEAPVRTISQLLPGRPVTGLDIGCGTGRYTRLLRAVLPGGSRLAASDVSAAMLAQLKAASQRHADEVAPLLAAAEELPLRAASLDLVTAFNCVHHFDPGEPLRLGRHADLQASALEHGRAAAGPGRGAPLLDLLPLPPGGVARVHRDLPGPAARPRGLLG